MTLPLRLTGAALNAIIVTLVLTTPSPLAAETGPEATTWRPLDHPASVVRTLIGYTRPAADLMISAEYQARLLELPLAEGSVVPANGAVIQLDDRLAIIAEQTAAADLTSAEATVAAAAAVVDVRQREAAYQAAEHARIARLVQLGRVTDVEGEAARLQDDLAQLAVATATADLAAAQARTGVASAALALATEQRQRHRVAVPGGWTVLARLAEPGALVGPMTPILHLVDTRELRIVLHLDERELAALRAAAAADQLTLWFPHHDQPAAVAAVASVAADFNPQTRKRQVELAIAGAAAPEASGGLEVHCELRIPDPSGAVLIPHAYVTERWEQYFVTTTTGDELAVVPLRRDQAMLAVSADSFTATTELVPAAAED